MLRHYAYAALLAAGGPLVAQTRAPVPGPVQFIQVGLGDETRSADDKLRHYLHDQTGIEFVEENPLDYDAVIDRLANWRAERGYFIARITPYAFVAAELLGADLRVLGTYVRTATGATTYHAYFVINRADFSAQPELSDFVSSLRRRATPATFAYQSEFSASSYFLPAMFFRDNSIYSMAASTPRQTAIHTRKVEGDATDLVRGVATGSFELAAVWDATKDHFETVDSLKERYGQHVYFVQLPPALPNDLLVATGSMDSVTLGKLARAVAAMKEDQIEVGDFQTWRDINEETEARQALAYLRQLATEHTAPATVAVHSSSPDPEMPRLLEAARQAIRLSGTELANYDDDFHEHVDYIWNLDRTHDGALLLTSTINGSDVRPQEFQVSFKDPDDLTRRIGGFIHSRLHRIRYLWPYRPDRPTVLRDVGFSLVAGDPVRMRRIHWLDPQRNAFSEEPEQLAEVTHADFFKFELSGPTGATALPGDRIDPMSNISTRVVLIRPATEGPIFRTLTAVLVLLLSGSAIATTLGLLRQRPVG